MNHRCDYEEGTKTEGIWRCPNPAVTFFQVIGQPVYSCAVHAAEFATVADGGSE